MIVVPCMRYLHKSHHDHEGGGGSGAGADRGRTDPRSAPVPGTSRPLAGTSNNVAAHLLSLKQQQMGSQVVTPATAGGRLARVDGARSACGMRCATGPGELMQTAAKVAGQAAGPLG
jgi:hypothetical protein